ncbi:MAG TPA: MotA/TolQ/ExbB proton channel family protein [Rhodanobacteraceae bacterium]
MTGTKLRLSVLIGVVAGLGIMVFVNHHEGDPLAALFNMESAVIVLGGCFTAGLCHFSWHGIAQSVRKSKWLVHPPEVDPERLIVRFEGWARIARRDGVLALQSALKETAGEKLLHDGLQMVVDGTEIDTLRTLLHQRVETDATENEEPGTFWDAMGGYAPTLGVLGAVMGLIHVMLHLGGGMNALGQGIATAFTATMYGVGLANLVFIPIGKRLSAIAADLDRSGAMAVEGLVLLAGGANPQTLRTHLQGFVSGAGAKGGKAKATVGENANNAESGAPDDDAIAGAPARG